MLDQCWPTVYDVGSTLVQHWIDASCLLVWPRSSILPVIPFHHAQPWIWEVTRCRAMDNKSACNCSVISRNIRTEHAQLTLTSLWWSIADSSRWNCCGADTGRIQIIEELGVAEKSDDPNNTLQVMTQVIADGRTARQTHSGATNAQQKVGLQRKAFYLRAAATLNLSLVKLQNNQIKIIPPLLRFLMSSIISVFIWQINVMFCYVMLQGDADREADGRTNRQTASDGR